MPAYSWTLDDQAHITYYAVLAHQMSIPVRAYSIPSMTKVRLSDAILLR